MTKTIATVGVFLTEDERGHLTRLCTELEVLEESALRNREGPEAKTRAAEQAALRKLMELPADVALAVSESTELTVHDHRIRQGATAAVLYFGTAVAVALALLGVQPVFCAALPAAVAGIPTGLWAWRDLRDFKRRRLAREARR
jgi:hypothetical protein